MPIQQSPFEAPSVYWETARGAARTMKGHAYQSYDVVIIGAGIMGLLTALILNRRGKKVCIIDKGAIGSEAAGNNGGIVLDLMEGSPVKIAKRYRSSNGAEIVQKILSTSAKAVNDMRHLERDYGIATEFKATGYITVFKNGQARASYLGIRSFISKLLPKLYNQKNDTLLNQQQIGTDEYASGIYSKIGGIYNPAITILSLLKKLHENSIAIFENTEITHLEAGIKSSVDIVAASGAVINAKRVVLAGGATYRLLKDVVGFVPPECVAAAMIATSPLPETLYQSMVSHIRPDVPIQSSETYSPPYWRFEELPDGKKRLLFGAGGRAGANERSEISNDVLKELMRVFPVLTPYLNTEDERKRVIITNSWARDQHFTENELPQFVLASPISKTLLPWPEIHNGMTKKEMPRAPIIGIFGLAGHGNAFSIRFAKIAAAMVMNEPWAYAEARVFSPEVTPMRPFGLRRLLSRLAAERS